MARKNVKLEIVFFFILYKKCDLFFNPFIHWFLVLIEPEPAKNSNQDEQKDNQEEDKSSKDDEQTNTATESAVRVTRSAVSSASRQAALVALQAQERQVEVDLDKLRQLLALVVENTSGHDLQVKIVWKKSLILKGIS